MIELLRKCFFHSLWLTLHLFVSIAVQLRAVYLVICSKCVMFAKSYNVEERKFGKVVAQSWTHVPNHITILLPSCGNYQLTDLVQLVYWAMCLRIRYISFYDPLDLLRKREEDLIARIRKRFNAHQHLIWHGATTSSHNGYTGAKIHAKILDQSRSAMVQACKTLIQTKSNDWSVDAIDACLRRSYEFPDPQLCIYSGAYLNLQGAPAWQMHLTEFVPVESLRNINLWDFLKVIERFQVCQQRCGK